MDISFGSYADLRPVPLSCDLMMGKLIGGGLKALDSLSLFYCVKIHKYPSTYLPSTVAFKQYPNESRAVDQPKDAPRNRISTLHVGRESLLTEHILRRGVELSSWLICDSKSFFRSAYKLFHGKAKRQRSVKFTPNRK